MSLCSQDWCGNHENPPASTSWMMESQEWATTPSCCSIFTLSMLTFWLLAPTEVFFQSLCYVTWCGYGSLWSWFVFSCVGRSFHRLLYCTGHVWRQIGTSSLMLLGYNSILCRIKKKTKSHKFKKVSWSRLLDLAAPLLGKSAYSDVFSLMLKGPEGKQQPGTFLWGQQSSITNHLWVQECVLYG